MSSARSEYRRQIARCAQALAMARNGEVEQDIVGEAPLEALAMFTDGNLDKRRLKLRDQFDLLNEAVDDLDDWIVKYIRTVPLAAYDTGSSDADAFLCWLSNRVPLTPEQQDFVTCQQSRYAVERAAEKNRLAHVHFQELHTLCDRLLPAWGTDTGLWIHLNPLTAWATLKTPALLDEDTEPPATVVFFPVEDIIRTAVLEPAGEAVVRDLETAGPCRLANLVSHRPELNCEEIVEIGRDLAELGLAAFG